MGEEGTKARRAADGLSFAIRVEIAEAMSAADGQRLSDALMEGVQSVLSPLMAAGFIVEQDGEVELRRFLIDEDWQAGLSAELDFSWTRPLLSLGVENGASLIGPPIQGAEQVAAVMDLGDDRLVYFVIAGHYANPEWARKKLAAIASEAGTASQVMTRNSARAADLAALRERERLSRDLHDSLSQSLWSLSMLAETADSMTDPDNPLHAVIRQITELSLTSQEEMRSLLINLRSTEPSRQTIAGTLEALVRDFRGSNTVEVVASIAEADLEPHEVMALRRIAEEALNNVSRHANASSVGVLFDTHPTLSLRIVDDGDGFDAKPVEGHLGLRVMGERAGEVDLEFSLDSSPGLGSAVTVAADLSKVPPRPCSAENFDVPTKRSALALLLASILFASLAVGSFLVSGSNQSSAEQAQAELDSLAISEQRVLVCRASSDEASARVLEGLGRATSDDVAAAMAERARVIAEARRVAEPLVNVDTMSGQRALSLVDELLGAVVDAPEDQRLDQLYAEIGRMQGPSLEPVVDDVTPAQSLGSLAALNPLITFAALEAMVARYAMEPDAFEPPESTRVVFESYAEIVRDFGGYFGPDESMPLRNGAVPINIALVHERDAVVALSHIIVDAQLWDDDQWVRRWRQDGPPPPTSLDSYIERSRAATIAARELIDSRFDARASELLAEHDEGQNRSMMFRITAGLLILPALAALAGSLRIVRRRRRALEADRAVDPLTGLGNRSALDGLVGPLLREHPQHALITLDIDRLAFINDVHGTGVGDRLLQVVSEGLRELADSSPNTRGSAVRIGDDEFLLSLHSNEPIPAEMIDRAMNRLRSTMLSTPDGSFVRSGFSYGVVFAEGTPALESLIAACNLEMYEDKARLDAV